MLEKNYAMRRIFVCIPHQVSLGKPLEEINTIANF